MQLNLKMATNTEIRKSWAFAAYSNRVRRPRKSTAALNQSVITSVSKEAKAQGVQVGMRYEEAKALVPGMRILVYRK